MRALQMSNVEIGETDKGYLTTASRHEWNVLFSGRESQSKLYGYYVKAIVKVRRGSVLKETPSP